MGHGSGATAGGLGHAAPSPIHYPGNAAGPPTAPYAYREQAPRPRLTHFLAIPLGQDKALRDTVEAFTDALLKAAPAIPGLDASIVVPARRLHFTLGVMSLEPDEGPAVGDQNANADAGSGTARAPPRTLEAAKSVLREVRPKIMALLGEEPLRVALDCLDIMKPEHGDRARAHVMWVGPGESEGLRKLEQVAGLVQDAFKAAGLLVDEGRPFKNHCTVLNTVYRKPALKWRFPFSYQSILVSDAMKAIRVKKAAVDPGELDARRRTPVRVDLGACAVDEIQICEMGSWGPEGEYVAVARESLTWA